MNSPANHVRFDVERQQVFLDGVPLNLPDKAARVLAKIVGGCPHPVSRAELIDDIWSGNFLIGERGLNQALWLIRSKLGDDAREPTLIRTLPREGYQWLVDSRQSGWRDRRFATTMSLIAGICVATFIMLTTAPQLANDREFTLPSQCHIDDRNDVHAYRLNRELHVDIENGCRLIADSDGTKVFGRPVVSEDGKHVAFTVTENSTCHFVAVDLEGGKRIKFDSCVETDG